MDNCTKRCSLYDDASDGRMEAMRQLSHHVESDILCDEHRRAFIGYVARKGGTERVESSLPRDLKPSLETLATRNAGGSTTRLAAENWADRAADVWQEKTDNFRALVSGSIDIPQLVNPEVVADSRPERILDLFVNRVTLTGNEFSFLKQTVRTNNADVVADGGTKPTSVYTLAEVNDRARVVAHLSEPAPNRILADHKNVRRFLSTEMAQGVLDALESQIVEGDGQGENLEGILENSDTTGVQFDTDIPTSLRKGWTALQDIGENPNAFVLSTADAEELDLEREGASGGYLAAAEGYSNIFKGARVVVSPSLSAGVAILADWTQAKLFVRENVRLDINQFDSDLFDENLFKMRAEGRFGFGILRPAAFAVIETTAG